jgi:hypothetical protein
MRLVSGAVWLRHWSTEFRKHVLPRLFRPGPVEAPFCQVYLRFGDFGSWVLSFLWTFGCDSDLWLEVAEVDGFPFLGCTKSISGYQFVGEVW